MAAPAPDSGTLDPTLAAGAAGITAAAPAIAGGFGNPTLGFGALKNAAGALKNTVGTARYIAQTPGVAADVGRAAIGDLRAPISAWDLARGYGRGLMTVGKAAMSPAVDWAAAIPTLAGMVASHLAGGSLSAGANPAMFSRALGEGYARYAPTWMGGLSSQDIASGDQFGAGGDLEGGSLVGTGDGGGPYDRAAPGAVRRAPVAVNPQGNVIAAPTAAAQVPATTAAMPPTQPMTATMINDGSFGSPGAVPAYGTGAMVDNQTGKVVNFNDHTTPGYGAVPSAVTMGSGYPAGSLEDAMSKFTGATLTEKRIANDNLRRATMAKIGEDYAVKAPGAQKDALATALSNEYLKQHPGDFAGAAQVLIGNRESKYPYKFTAPLVAGRPGALLNSETGAVTAVTPKPVISTIPPGTTYTDADVAKYARAHNKTAAEVEAAYKAAGARKVTGK
ncbi:MAG: hypothetical protein ACYDBH_00490 [Acidobacteriaceae bacterium]